MNPQHFLDTNILVYAAAGKVNESAKYAICKKIIAQTNFVISSQVLGEFYAVVRKRQHERLPINEAQAWVRLLTNYCLTDVDQSIVQSAMFISERFQIQFWDATLVASCEKLKISTLYSEDLSHGQKYGSVTAINPLREEK
jgi:predicted nucleic acid-binding protein